MRILILSQYCSPEPDLKKVPFAKKLKELGHDVEILTGYPNYPSGKIYDGYRNFGIQREKIDDVDIIRVPLYANHSSSAIKRIWNYLSFAISASIFGVFCIKKPDIIYAFHAPATISIPAIFFKLIYRSKILYDINDYWPDSLAATGMINNKNILNLIHGYCRFSYRFFNHINVVSNGFKDKLITDGVPVNKISVIYNWPHPYRNDPSKLFEKHKEIFEEGLSITYAGNIGIAQNLGVLIDAAQMFREVPADKLKFIIIGDGIEKASLIGKVKELGLQNIFFIDKVSLNELGSFLEATDFHLIHLKKDPLFEITLPSKIFSCLSSKKPIICGVTGEANKIISDSGAGITFNSDDVLELVNVVKTALLMSKEECVQMGTNGYDFYLKTFSIEIGVERFNEVFLKLSTNH